MVVTKYLTVLSGKYPANLYRIPDSAGCLNFTGYRIPVSGSGTSLEKNRVGRSEINFFLNIFFMVLAVFCWAICSRVPTSILTRDAYFLWTNLGNLVQ